jgi:hypothetical protein
MPKCALPSHLREKLHNDWPWPLSKLPRSINAFGPRCAGAACECGGKGYRPWPPRLVRGRGVARWENTGASSILEIPDLVSREVKAADVYGSTFTAIERNPGHPNFNQAGSVVLSWREAAVIRVTSAPAGAWNFPGLIIEENLYSPSTIQEFSPAGWMELEPIFKTWHRDAFGKTPNYRIGYRPDHLDGYYNNGPYAGLNFE